MRNSSFASFKVDVGAGAGAKEVEKVLFVRLRLIYRTFGFSGGGLEESCDLSGNMFDLSEFRNFIQ